MLETELRQAFETGNPQLAWGLVLQLVELARQAMDEAGKARFKSNLGTDICRHCTGLQAGPGVEATCYQLQRCHFTNLRSDKLDSHQAIVARLLESDHWADRRG